MSYYRQNSLSIYNRINILLKNLKKLVESILNQLWYFYSLSFWFVCMYTLLCIYRFRMIKD